MCIYDVITLRYPLVRWLWLVHLCGLPWFIPEWSERCENFPRMGIRLSEVNVIHISEILSANNCLDMITAIVIYLKLVKDQADRGSSSFWWHSSRKYYGKYELCLSCVFQKSKTILNLEYARMAVAIADLAKSSRKSPIIFSLCEWGWVGKLNKSPCAYTYLLPENCTEPSMALGQAVWPKLEVN